jgi:YVTN family beta-propeller protein
MHDEHRKGGATVSGSNARYGRDSKVLDFGDKGFPVFVEIPVDNGPISGMVPSPDGSRLIVTNYGSNSVSVIDTDTCRVVETVAGIDEPFAIAMGGADPDRAYVTTVSSSYDAIAVIDVPTNIVIGNHPLALSVSDLAVSADGRYVYTSRNGARGADVAILDTTTGKLQVIEITGAPGTSTECVRVSSDGGRLYVGTNGPSGGQLVVIRTRPEAPAQIEAAPARPSWRRKKPAQTSAPQTSPTEPGVVATIAIGLPLRDVALSPDGTKAYVAGRGVDCDAVVDVVDTGTNKITATHKIAEIDGILTGLTLSGDGERAYLVSDDGITVLSTRTRDVIGIVRVATQPSCVAESPDGQYLYIADYTGAVIVAPVASAIASDAQRETEATEGTAEWAMPELPEYEAALA